MGVENHNEDNHVESVDNSQENKVVLPKETTDLLSTPLLQKNKEGIEKVLTSNENLQNGLNDALVNVKNDKEKGTQILNKFSFRLSYCKTENDINEAITDFINENKSGGCELANTELLDMRDQKIEDTEETEKKGAEAGANEAEARANEAEAKKSAEYFKSMQETVNKFRDSLLEGHDDIKQKTEAEAKRIKDSLKIDENTQKELKKDGIDDNFIYDYILANVTLNEVRKDPSNFDEAKLKSFEGAVGNLNDNIKLSRFDIFFKSIDNAYNIADTDRSSFDAKNAGDTRREMFNDAVGNKSLIDARNDNKGTHSEEYEKMFKDEDISKTIDKYGKFFPDEAKHFLQDYKQHIKDGTVNQYEQTEEGKKVKETLLNVKKSVDDYTENFIEETCLMSHIKGMTMCIGEDFNLNKAREIENVNGVLTLNGHVDGADFGLRHDINTPGAYLQTNSKFSISPDKNTFTILDEGKFPDSIETQNTNFILPSQEEVFGMVSQRVMNAMQDGGALANAGSREEFKSVMENDLQRDIMGMMDVAYEGTENAHNYIRNQVNSEKVLKNAVGLIKDINPDGIEIPGSIRNDNANKKVFDFIKILNFNLENSTAEEKEKLDKSITQIRKIITESKDRNGAGSATEGGTGTETRSINGINETPVVENSIASKYLKNPELTNNGNNESRNSQRDLVSELFSKYSEYSQDTRFAQEGTDGVSSKMIIDDLYQDLFGTTLSPASSKKSQIDTEKEDQTNATIDMYAKWPPDDGETAYGSPEGSVGRGGSEEDEGEDDGGEDDAKESDNGGNSTEGGDNGGNGDKPDVSEAVANGDGFAPKEGDGGNQPTEGQVESGAEGGVQTNASEVSGGGTAAVTKPTNGGQENVRTVAESVVDTKNNGNNEFDKKSDANVTNDMGKVDGTVVDAENNGNNKVVSDANVTNDMGKIEGRVTTDETGTNTSNAVTEELVAANNISKYPDEVKEKQPVINEDNAKNPVNPQIIDPGTGTGRLQREDVAGSYA